jgi:hypothetical protein
MEAQDLVDLYERCEAAERTLRDLGYTYVQGAEFWKPPVKVAHEWLQENTLVYRLTCDVRPVNCDEINVTMSDKSRSIEKRTQRATEIMNLLNQGTPYDQPIPCPAPAQLDQERELLQLARAYKEYIDALPDDVVASLPAMPGVDGDWASEVLDRAARAAPQPATADALPDEKTCVDYVLQYGGRCRDCADENGVCPGSGLPCGGQRKAVTHVMQALRYGLQHGYLRAAQREVEP